MRKIFLFILLFTICASNASAAVFHSGEEVNILKEVKEDLYTAGGRVNISSNIDGDVVVAGGELDISGNVKEDLIIAGGEINISGTIGDDVRAAGGKIVVDGIIKGDLVVAGGDIIIKKNAVIKGSLISAGGRIIVDGKVLGNSSIATEELILNGIFEKDVEIELGKFSNPENTGVIAGNLKYESINKSISLENTTKGKKTFTQLKNIKKEIKNKALGFLSVYLVIKVVGIFVFGTLLFFFFKNYFLQVTNSLKQKVGKSFINGLLVFGGTPIIIILLFISIVGIPFGLFGLFLYIFLFVFLEIINAVIISSLIVEKYKIEKTYVQILILFGLSVLFGLINSIDVLIGLFTIGAIFTHKFDR